MTYIREAIEAVKMDTKSKIIGLVTGLVVLFLKPFARLLSMTYFYNKFTWAVVLVTIFFAVSLCIDLEEKQRNKRERNREDKKKREKEVRKQQQFLNYVLGLKGRKWRIVRNMYANHHHRNYVSVNDSDTLDLIMHNVILPTKNTQRVDSFGKEREYNELQELFILAPRVVQIIDENKKQFDL